MSQHHNPYAQGAPQGPYPPNYRYPPQPPEPRNSLGLAAAIIGVVGLFPGMVPLTWWMAATLGVVGLGLGLAALGRVRAGRASNRKTTWLGVVASGLALALGIWGASIFFTTLTELGEDLEAIGGGQLSTEDAAQGAADAAAAGQLVAVGDWRVALQPANLDAAGVITTANQFAPAPPDGVQYVMARADVAYQGAETGQPWIDLRVRILGAAGNMFDANNGDCGPLPSSLLDVGEMVAGATAAGNVCRAVPVDQLETL